MRFRLSLNSHCAPGVAIICNHLRWGGSDMVSVMGEAWIGEEMVDCLGRRSLHPALAELGRGTPFRVKV